MEHLHQLFLVFISYIQSLWWPLALGFFISGLFHEFIPKSVIDRYLCAQGIMPVFFAAFVGTLLPVCCLGSLPIAIALRRRGAPLGVVLAFLVATPATSLSALLVSWKLFGYAFTFYIFVSVILMGIVIGLGSSLIRVEAMRADAGTEKSGDDACAACDGGFQARLQAAFKFAFITLPKDIGLELVIGILVASVVATFAAIGTVIRLYLHGPAGYIFALVAGILTYVCSTASVPLAHAFYKEGMDIGAALTFLIAGPITSYGSILVLRKEFGKTVLLFYLTAVCVFALAFGFLFSHVRVML